MAPCIARNSRLSGATAFRATHRITGSTITSNALSTSIGLSNLRTSSAVTPTATRKTTPNSAASLPSRLNLIRLSCAAGGAHTKTLHPPIQRLPGQSQTLRCAADIAAGGMQTLFDRLARDRIRIAPSRRARLRAHRHEVQIRRLHDVVARQELGAFDRIAQLTHVTRPRVRQHRGACLVAQLQAAAEKMHGQWQHIVHALGQWRDRNLDDIETVVQILTEAA